jgi:hypothetical protein
MQLLCVLCKGQLLHTKIPHKKQGSADGVRYLCSTKTHTHTERKEYRRPLTSIEIPATSSMPSMLLNKQLYDSVVNGRWLFNNKPFMVYNQREIEWYKHFDRIEQ